MDSELNTILTKEEISKLRKILGRDPNAVELGMFEIMWSEHCSYKSSTPMLKLFPTESKDVILGVGYDAGVVKITDKLAIAIRIESHNHPSAIEPVAGAATGVGGIIRDIISVGARPIAVLDPLRFGDLDDERSRYLFENVVKGIGGYGNCLGIPTVGGEVEFDESFRGNPLVNVVGVGLVEIGKEVYATAKDAGDSIILVGSSTGRDGIHGVSFASEELTSASEEDRPAVQIGDPFTEKLIIEATIEIIESGCVVGCKDLGGGGLTCAVSETVSRGGKGAKIDISLVHQREEDMTPYEIMLSESQERMLFVINKGHEDKVFEICDKYDLVGVRIGEVTDDKTLKIEFGGKLVAEMPVGSLAEGFIIKRSERGVKREKEITNDKFNLFFNDFFNKIKIKKTFKKSFIKNKEKYNLILLKVLSSPNIASKRWVYQQYDHEVQLRTIVKPGDDAAVLRINDKIAIALTADCNSKHVKLNPYHGGAGAAAEAYRNIVSMGAKPLCIVDCLNFGNPEKAEQFWEFKESVRGLADTLKILNIPVVGGNVSFYNETEGKAVNPSPVVAMVGKLDINRVTTKDFKNIGDCIILIGETKKEFGGSEYYNLLGIKEGFAPRVDFDLMKRTNDTILDMIRKNLINACHDCSNGGVGVSLVEMLEEFGAEIEIKIPDLRTDEFLFSESHSRFIVGCNPKDSDAVLELCNRYKIKADIIGEVTKRDFIVRKGCDEIIKLGNKEIEGVMNYVTSIMEGD